MINIKIILIYKVTYLNCEISLKYIIYDIYMFY